MVQFRYCLLLAALCASSLAGITTPKPEILTIPTGAQAIATEPAVHPHPPADNSTTTTSTSNTTTLKPAPIPPADNTTTTTQKPAPIPPADNTTTSTTTTLKPAPVPPADNTTTTTTTTTTTSKPNPPPTPAPAPGPPGPPEQGNWSYHNASSNVSCIIVEFAAQLNVTYQKLDNSSMGHAVFNVPANATVVGGSCDEKEQFLELNWPVGSSNFTNVMRLKFEKNDTLKSYTLKNLTFELSPDQFVNASSTSMVVLYRESAWQTPFATSYRCDAPTRVNMAGDAAPAASPAGWVTFSKLREEAFRTVNGTGFSSPRDCASGDVPDAVPIAVGCALGGLVVVVLVAYLVGRHRSAARGYLSM